MRQSRHYHIVIIFALLHAAVCILAKVFGFYNELLLTLLTMAMSVVLSMNQRMTPFFVITMVVLVNFAGIYLGSLVGSIYRHQLPHDSFYARYIHTSNVTFVVTVIIGVLQIIIADLFKKTRFYRDTDSLKISWLIGAFAIVMLVRMFRILNNSMERFEENIALNIIIDYIVSFAVIFYISTYAVRVDRKYAREKEQKNLAQYSYQRLKEQIEPHFLFNSLNTLDGLVCEDKSEQASLFIHKLSSIYRYMIENENEKIIYIRDEINFVRKYTDLLSVRFADGFKVNIDISESDQMRSIVPCALQLLVENATKHNVIMPDNPLVVDIRIVDGFIVVSNPLDVKVTSQISTKRGLKYLSQQYVDITGKDITIINDGQYFTVKLPLL